MTNRAEPMPKRLSGKEAGRAPEPSCLCRTSGSTVSIRPSQADATDGSRRDSAADRTGEPPTGGGIVPAALVGCGSTTDQRTGSAETPAATHGSENAG